MRAGHCKRAASFRWFEKFSFAHRKCMPRVARSAGVASDSVLVGRTEDRRAPGARGAASRNRLADDEFRQALPYALATRDMVHCGAACPMPLAASHPDGPATMLIRVDDLSGPDWRPARGAPAQHARFVAARKACMRSI